MPERFIISLGGIPISLISDQVSGDYDLVKRAIDFRSPDRPEVTLRVHCGWFPDLNTEQITFEAAHAWQLLKVDGKSVIKISSPNLDPYQIGVFPPDFRSGDIYVAEQEGAPGRYIFPLSYPMGELYIMHLLGTGLGLLFHASGVIYRGQGYLFVGHGGAGKTTTARLWEELPDVKVVNDDKVIVRKEAGEFRLYGTPWHGEGAMALPDSAPLKRVFILKQAAQNTVAPLHPVDVAGRLLARTFIPLWNADIIDFSLKFLEELSNTLPCQELSFLPDSSAVDFVRSLP